MFEGIWKFKWRNKGITQLKNNTDGNIHFICLSELECGKLVKVIKLQGNHVLINKLNAMGIFEGSTILKKSAISAKGPVIVEKGSMQFALGYDIAEKILVECL